MMTTKGGAIDIIKAISGYNTNNIMHYQVKHGIGLAVLLLALWLGLSGQLSPLMLSLGLVSTLLIVYIAHRMDTIDQERYPAHMTVLMLRFWLFLARAVIVANIDVIKRILKPGKNISPQFFHLPLTKKADLSRVIYANAITMTPGTVSVMIDEDSIIVHSLSKEAANELSSGRMADAVPEDYERSST